MSVHQEKVAPGIFRRRGSRFLWIKWYDANGAPHRESTKTASETAAKRLLTQRQASAAKGEPVVLHAARITVGELLDDLGNDYRNNGQVLAAIEPNVARLRSAFGKVRAQALTTAMLREYVARQRRSDENKEGLANGTLNRDLSALRRAFSLAQQGTPPKLAYKPHFPMLKEGTPRQGFFERGQYEAVLKHIDDPIKPVVTFAYITGWRVPSEVLTLTWPQVDLAACTVRLEPGTTKNKEGRTFPFAQLPELRLLLEERRAHTEAVQRQTGRIIPYVFHRGGRPIKDFRGAWAAACKAAGCPDRVPHDFRRSAVRNLVRAGVPERVAMQLTGHKTRAVFERYNIVSEGDLAKAGALLSEQLRTASGTKTGTVTPLRAPHAAEQHS